MLLTFQCVFYVYRFIYVWQNLTRLGKPRTYNISSRWLNFRRLCLTLDWLYINWHHIQNAPDAPLYVEVSQPPQLLGNYPILSPDYVSTSWLCVCSGRYTWLPNWECTGHEFRRSLPNHAKTSRSEILSDDRFLNLYLYRFFEAGLCASFDDKWADLSVSSLIAVMQLQASGSSSLP